MKLTENLGMYEELFPGSPGLGHIPRAMQPQDSTDGGIVNRIKSAVMQGMITPQAGQYLIDNLLQDDSTSQQAVRSMGRPKNMPMLENTFPYSTIHGLLGE